MKSPGSNSYSDMLNGRGDPAGSCGSDQVVIQFRSGVFHSVEQEELPVVFGYYAGIPAIVVFREDQLERFDSP